LHRQGKCSSSFSSFWTGLPAL